MVGREEEPKVRRVPRAEVPEGGGGGGWPNTRWTCLITCKRDINVVCLTADEVMNIAVWRKINSHTYNASRIQQPILAPYDVRDGATGKIAADGRGPSPSNASSRGANSSI